MNKKEKTQAIIDYLSLPYNYNENRESFLHNDESGISFDIHNIETALDIADLLGMDISINGNRPVVLVSGEYSSSEMALHSRKMSEVLTLTIVECAMMEIEYQNSLKKSMKP